jgi:hypothetical protein
MVDDDDRWEPAFVDRLMIPPVAHELPPRSHR